MTSVVTGNRPSKCNIHTYKGIKARSSKFEYDDNKELADWIIKHGRCPGRKGKKKKTPEVFNYEKGLYDKLQLRMERYVEALEHKLSKKLSPNEEEANELCIAGFVAIQEYIEHGTGKSMLDLGSSWWRDKVVPKLQKVKEEQGPLVAEKKPEAKPKAEPPQKKQEVTPSKVKNDDTDVTDALADLEIDEVKAKDRQKYYTRVERIEKCIDAITERLDIDKERDVIIEPSAGDGRWIPYLKKLCNNVFAYDIEPDGEDIEKIDFWSNEMSVKMKRFKKQYKRVHIVGNPPWQKLEEKFIQLPCETKVDSISYLLPASYMKTYYLYRSRFDSYHKNVYCLPVKYNPIHTDFLKDEPYDGQYVGDQKKHLNSCFIIWEHQKESRKKIEMPAENYAPCLVLQYKYIECRNRKKANVQFYKGDAKCECYFGEEFQNDRYYYFLIGKAHLNWFWWRPEFKQGIQRSDQKKSPREHFVDAFNNWRESTMPDPFRERFYTLGKPSLNKYDILSNLHSFFHEYRPTFNSSMVETMKKHIETVTDYNTELIYGLREGMIDYFINRLYFLKNAKKTDKHNESIRLLYDLRQLNEDTFNKKKLAENEEEESEEEENLFDDDDEVLIPDKCIHTLERPAVEEDIKWEFIEEIVCDDDVVSNLRQGKEFTGEIYLEALEAKECYYLAPALARMTGLDSLWFGGGDIGDDGCYHLAPALSNMKSLRLFECEGNNIGDEGCCHLAIAFLEMENLEELSICGNKIANKGCRQLAPALAKMKLLEKVSLNDNHIGEDGCCYLWKYCHSVLINLESLDLCDNNIPESRKEIIITEWVDAGKSIKNLLI